MSSNRCNQGAAVPRGRRAAGVAVAFPPQGRTTSAGRVVSTPAAGRWVCTEALP